MKKLQDYARQHPFQTVSILGAAVVVGAIICQDYVAIGLCVLAAIYTLFCLAYARHARRVLAVLLAVSLCAAPQAKAAPYVLGGLVILAACGLGYVGCRAVKCAKKIPKERGTNLIEEFHVAGEDCEYGAAFFWADECYAERPFSTNREPVVTVLNVVVESETNCALTLTFDAANQSVQSLDELREELAGHGLSVPDSPQFGRVYECYGRNRHPAAAEQVPIKFSWATRTASIGAGGVNVRVESSADLVDWQPLVNLNAAVGTVLAIPDVSHGRQFFRVTTGATP